MSDALARATNAVTLARDATPRSTVDDRAAWPGLAQDWKRTCTGAYVRWLLRAGLKWKRTRMADPSDSGFIFSVAGAAEQCKGNRPGKDTKVMGKGAGFAALSFGEKRRTVGCLSRNCSWKCKRGHLRDCAGQAGINGLAARVWLHRRSDERFGDYALTDPIGAAPCRGRWTCCCSNSRANDSRRRGGA